MPSFRRVMLYLNVIRRLGFFNVAYIVWYRLSLKSGIRRRFFPEAYLTEKESFFYPAGLRSDYPDEFKQTLFENAEKLITGQLRYYAHHWKNTGNPPNWFLNPFNGRIWPDPNRHWTKLADFNPEAGDIKNIWEASRFEWAVSLARAYAVSGKEIYLDTLNSWLGDWARNNPPNRGPNWKCGQEASVRVFNLLQVALILDQWEKPSLALKELIYRHLERIAGNIRYAIAQDNNHGTSEAAALFVGGGWLRRIGCSGIGNKECIHFERQGRKWLEDRVKKLVGDDGSFSQHSVTYHRVFLDTLIFAEYWRRKLNAALLSETFAQRACAAVKWLMMLTDFETGNAPNLGANDGALFLNNHSCDYRDFRPTIQTASVLFQNQKAFDAGLWDEPTYWFGLNGEETPTVGYKKTSEVLPGGYVIMMAKESWGLLRFPMYRFRPGHNDVFHFDLWFRGRNICRDAGSYSYNTDELPGSDYFPSVKAHNAVRFDEHEQMPRLGRFLLGYWIKADHVGEIENLEDGYQRWTGSYHDDWGNQHQRTVTWAEDNWSIEDSLSGNFSKAEATYRLIPGEYRMDGNLMSASWGRVEVTGADIEITLSEGFESLYYWQKQPVKVLSISAGKNCSKITTRFFFELMTEQG